MNIHFSSNAGSGFSDFITVRDGMTVGELFREKMPGQNRGNHLVRVNRIDAGDSQVLRHDDRVSITPSKIEGARVGA
jgi:hypothetical protein